MVIGSHSARDIYNQPEGYYTWPITLCVTVCNDICLMERFSASLAICGWDPVDFLDSHCNRPEIQNFDVIFAVSLNELLKKQLSCQQFEIPTLPCDITVMEHWAYIMKIMGLSMKITQLVNYSFNFNSKTFYCHSKHIHNSYIKVRKWQWGILKHSLLVPQVFKL